MPIRPSLRESVQRWIANLPPLRLSPLPAQFRQQIPWGGLFFKLKQTLAEFNLRTVCEEAKCPNRTDCYNRGALTFQILGEICTRRCGFCAETTGRPQSVEFSEPSRILAAAKKLNLSHIVITAPARDDLADGGASIFAQTVLLLRENLKNVSLEILVSDFSGCEKSLLTVLKSQPDIFNHNIETIRRLTPQVRAKATYEGSLKVLKFAAEFSAPIKIKSGLMVGLGETWDELTKTFMDLKNCGVEYVTIGQYLAPSEKHLSVEKFYKEIEFSKLRKLALEIGFEKVFSGALVRSSYFADQLHND